MAVSTGFASVSITRSKDFSWVFFADWFLVLVLTIWLLFHFNRVIAAIISSLLELTLWRNQKVRIDVQSIKFSFLGGRLFFKNLTIIDKDQTVTVVQGTFTWRYWIPNVRKKHKTVTDQFGDLSLNSKLPCRFYLHARGVEVFVYNRTVSFDTILEQLSGGKTHKDKDDFAETSSTDSTESIEAIASPELSFIAKFLPLQIKIDKGALVAGNKLTQAVVIASYSSCQGVIDLQNSANSLDIARMDYDMTFDKLNLMLKPNIVYEGPQEQVHRSAKRPKFTGKRWALLRQFGKMWNLIRRHKDDSEAFQQWRGLMQYLETDTGSISELQHAEKEYAKYTTLLTSEACKSSYYYDCPGIVPLHAAPTNPLHGQDIGNGGDAPKFGLDLQFSQTTVHYGPWAERQRHSLHQMIFPTLCKDAKPQQRLSPGQLRTYTEFAISMEVLDDFIVRVPLRESSKNEEFSRMNKDVIDPFRPFGWIELKCNEHSSLAFGMAFTASKGGYANTLELSLQGLEIRSSVNHDILLRCDEHIISADVGYPLEWDGLAAWSFVNVSKGLDLFLLREHITLISDMFTDFGMGPATPYERFRPFTYEFMWKVLNYKFYFNINDANIVNNPLDFNDNCYMSLQGKEIVTKAHIPMDAVIKTSSTVDYSISTPEFHLIIDTPPWHTLNNFLKKKEVGRAQDFYVDGSYTYYAEVGLDLVDTVIIACTGKYVGLVCYGFVMKYIMSIKENYFGDFTSFKTLEEYINMQGDLESGDVISETEVIDPKKLKRLENETDVHFSFCVDESCIILPYNLYDCHTNMSLHFNSLDLDIRFTNYYMDLQADMSPLKGYYHNDCDQDSFLDIMNFFPPEKDDFFIDGLTIHGHRMFGLPPVEPTCYCKWDISPGAVLFNSSTDVLSGFVKALDKLEFGYKNSENCLAMIEPEIFDTTQVCVKLPEIRFTVCEPGAQYSLNLELRKVIFQFIDFTNTRFIKKISADVEEIRIWIMDTLNHKILLDIGTSFKVSNFTQDVDFLTSRRKQNEHIILHDGPFHRMPFFVDDVSKDRYNASFGVISSSFPLPDVAPPLNNETIDMIFEDLAIDDTNVMDDEHESREHVNESFVQDFESEFLSSSKSSDEKRPKSKNFRETLAGLKIKPTLDYEDSEFKPTREADPECQTDNLIFNVGLVSVNACGESFPVILCFLGSYLRVSFKDSMDDLQVSVLSSINKRFSKIASCHNVRVVTPRISVLFTENGWCDHPLEKEDLAHFEVTLESPSLAASFKNDMNETDDDTVALHILSLSFFVGTSCTGVRPLTLKMSDIELWSRLLEDATTSVSTRSFHCEVDSMASEWTAHYIEKLMVKLDDLHKNFLLLIDNYLRTRVEFMYRVSMATNAFKIHHDPAVITRPAYIIRLSKQHIRGTDSWKIIARLRHIMDNAPVEWMDIHTKKFLSYELDAPPTVSSDVLSVFSEWRSWELRDIEHSAVFKYVFKEFAPKPLRTGLYEVSVEDSSVTFLSPVGVVNYVRADFLEFSGRKMLSTLDGGTTTALSDSLGLRVSSLKCKLGLLMHELLPFMNMKLPKSDTHNKKLPVTVNPETHLVVLIEDVDLKVTLPKTSLSITSSDVELSGILTETDDLHGFNVACGSKYFEVDIASDNNTCMNYSLTGFRALGTSTGDHSSGPKLIKITSDDAILTAGHGTDSCIEFLTNLCEDIAIVKAMDWTSFDLKRKENADGTKIPNTHVLFENKKFGWNIGIVDPFLSSGVIDKGLLEVIYNDGLLFTNVSSSLVSFNTRTYDNLKNILAISHHGSNLFAKFDTGSKYVEIDWNYQLTQLVVSEMLSKTKQLKRSIDDSIRFIDRLKFSTRRLLKALTNETPPVVKTEVESINFIHALTFKRLSISGLMLSFSVRHGDSSYSLELHKVLMSWHDIIFGTRKPYGDLEVGNTRFEIKSRDVPSKISQIIDVNLSVKVVSNLENDTQSLQVESSHFHILLHPTTIVKLLQLANDVQHAAEDLNIGFEKTGTSPKESQTTEKGEFFNFSSIHMLSYSFCVGLMFDSPSKSFPGIIAGSEKMFFITEDNLGKFSLISAYLSIAKGFDISDFFSPGDESRSANRAFLPNMQIAYATSGKNHTRDIQVRVTGEEFDVKFTSASVFAFEQTLKAISRVDKLKSNLRSTVKTPPASPQDGYYLPSNLTSINCIMNFAGGSIQLYRWDEFDVLDDELGPSFTIKTPAVEIISAYGKIAGPKEHRIDIEVCTFPSSNILLADCVPVLYDVVRGLKDLSYIFRDDRLKTSDVVATSTLDFQSLLSKWHVGFALRIDKQELILSCEPSAKVQAVVGIDGIDLRLSTNDNDDTQPLSGVLDIRNVGASLQHTYSREISASMVVRELLWSLIISQDEIMKVYSAGKLHHVQSYLNLKQLQDLDLFMDLWLPKNLKYGTSSGSMRSVSTSAEDDNIVLKFQKAYASSPTPWTLDVLILDFGLEVDLGPALGVLHLGLDKLWAVSRKKSLREQDLLVGLEKLSLRSTGRLNGYLDIKNIRVNSVIQWSIVGDYNAMPLLLLSAGFDVAEVKASFDYNVFMMGKIQQFSISLFNQVDTEKVLKDKLVASTECASIELFITAFAAANIMDIYNTLARIRQDSKISYKEDMIKNMAPDDKTKDMDIVDMIAALRTEIDVNFGKFVVHVYPSSLLDLQVLIFDLGGVTTHFEQQFSTDTLVSNLEMKLLDINVALSSHKMQHSEELLNTQTIDEFITHAMEARGGGIFIFPSWECVMETRSTVSSTEIDYKYRSLFGGKVDIRWNLGSINFIREMWTMHARSLSSRLSKLSEDGIPFIGDENLEQKIREVDFSSKYVYVPLEPPIIEAPQLRDLGDATPPLEWFGLHRKSFPGLTHQYAIVGLQKLVHEAEMQYGRVLGNVNPS